MPKNEPLLCRADSVAHDGIVVVKRDRFCAHALREIVADAYPGIPVTVCHTGAQALERLQAAPVKLGLFGLNLPDIDGLDLIIQVIAERLVSHSLVVSARSDAHSWQLLRRIRVDGFFDCSTDDGANLITAIRRVREGLAYFSPTVRPALNSGKPLLSHILSETELQVLAAIGDGSSDEEATTRLGVTATTVHTHRQHIMRKLGIQTRAALMRAAIEHGVVRFGADRILRPGMEQALAQRGRIARSPQSIAAASPSPDRRVVARASSN